MNKGKNMRTHLLSGIVKCPICVAGMFGNKSIKYKKMEQGIKTSITMVINIDL